MGLELSLSIVWVFGLSASLLASWNIIERRVRVNKTQGGAESVAQVKMIGSALARPGTWGVRRQRLSGIWYRGCLSSIPRLTPTFY